MPQPDQQRVRELFQQVIQLPVEQRESCLSGADVDPSVVRAVRHLLDYHRTATILAPALRDPTTAPDLPQPEVVTEAGAGQKAATVSPLLPRQTTQYFQNERRRMQAVIAAGVIAFLLIAAGLEWSIKRHVRSQFAATMQANLNEQVFALTIWLEAEFRVFESWARGRRLRVAVAALATRSEVEDLTVEQLRELGKPLNEAFELTADQLPKLSYAVWNRKYQLIADSDADCPVLGNGTTDYGSQLLRRVFRGETILWAPTSEGFITEGYTTSDVPHEPGIAIIVPVMADTGETPIAALLISQRGLQERFEEMLRTARFGEAGEAYAVDRLGFLMTGSRFAEQLHAAGLMAAATDSVPHPTLRVAQPKGSLASGKIDLRARNEWPLTKAALLVTRGESAADFDGYADYRGIQVVGTWAWLDRFGFGVILENDYASAYRAMRPLRIMNGTVLLLALLGFVASILKWRANLDHLRKLGADHRIGPYLVRERIGEGGMAQVFLATHSLLKRPTALKLLKPEQTNTRNLARFEREVQLASRLTHPNTIEIYDYGITKHDEFYCAMEFLSGFNLQALVELDGAQPPERVIHILRGICGSLREAHSLGLVHRDIKPQNVMLCERGGEPDFVKVLDFGLARDIAATEPSATSSQILVGTPMFIAPERIHDPQCLDPRSDIFSLGIVGFILLTATQPYATSTSVDSLLKALQSDPERPSSFVTTPIPPELDQLIYDCQQRQADLRPQSIDHVLEILDTIPVDNWGPTTAGHWWRDFGRLLPGAIR